MIPTRERDGCRIRVTETDSKRTYTPSPEKAARETDFYSLASEDLDSHKIPPLLMETILSQIEGSAKPIIDLLLDSGPAALGPLDALGLAQFLAFQVTRGRACRVQIMAMANAGMLKLWEGINDEDIAARLKEQGGDHSPEAVAGIRNMLDEWKDGKWTMAPQPAALVGYAASAAEPLAMTFLARPWRIYESVMPMITSDEPVVPVPLPSGNRREYTGLATAGVVLFPLDPHHLLAMFHPFLALDDLALFPELCLSEADEINLELAASSDRRLFELPNHTRGLALTVPRNARERSVFESIDVANRPEDDRVLARVPAHPLARLGAGTRSASRAMVAPGAIASPPQSCLRRRHHALRLVQLPWVRFGRRAPGDQTRRAACFRVSPMLSPVSRPRWRPRSKLINSHCGYRPMYSCPLKPRPANSTTGRMPSWSWRIPSK